jgi:hypothetical protein
MHFTELWQALRRIRRQPAFAVGVVTVLALAIGANSAMFALVNAILLRPLPFADPDRADHVHNRAPGSIGGLSLLDVNDYPESESHWTASASGLRRSANLTGRGDAERSPGMRVSGNYSTHGRAGRARSASAGTDEQRPSALISHGMWQRHFGGAVDAVSQPIVLNGEASRSSACCGRTSYPSSATRSWCRILRQRARRGNLGTGILGCSARLNPA